MIDGGGERHAGWLELFYDLMFVALVAQFAHPLVDHPGVGTGLLMLALFAPAWWLWVSTTLYLNLFGEGGVLRRVAVLAQMACLLVMAVGVEPAVEGHHALFVGAYVVSRLGLVVLRLVLRDRLPRSGSNLATTISLVLWLGSIPVPMPFAVLLWIAGLAVEVGAAVYRDGHRTVQITHLVERFGLFVIIVLGEGVAQLVAAVVTVHADPYAIVLALGAFAVLAALWWLYFDFGSTVAEAALKARPEEAFALARRIFVIGHFLPVGALLAVAAGLGALVRDPSSAPMTMRVVCVALVVYLLNNAVLGIAGVGQSLLVVVRWLVPPLVLVAVVLVLAGWMNPLAQLGLIVLALGGTTMVNRLLLPDRAGVSRPPPHAPF